MRITLSIEGDVLAAAKVLARAQRLTVGAVISDLARRSLELGVGASRNGVPLLPIQRARVTLADVNSLRDELP